MKEKLEKRKANLMVALEQLNVQVKEILKQIEVQKGAISECNYWIDELDPQEEENNNNN